MLTANLWIQVGLVKGALGIVVSIGYQEGGPPALSLVAMVKFDKYHWSMQYCLTIQYQLLPSAKLGHH